MLKSTSRIAVLSATTIAIAAASAFAAAPAFADLAEGVTAGTGTLTFTHTSNAGMTADVSGIEYGLSVTPVTAADGSVKGSYAATSDMVVIPGTVKLSAHTDTVDAKTYSNASVHLGDILDISGFDNAGVYKFLLTEAPAGGTSGDSDIWSYGDEQYYLTVWVVNDGTGLKFEQFTITGVDDSAKGDEAAFTSTYKKTSKLNVTKEVVGDYADKTFDFPVSVTVYVPAWFDTSEVTVDNDSTPKDLPAAVTWSVVEDEDSGAKGMKAATYELALHDGGDHDVHRAGRIVLRGVGAHPGGQREAEGI